VALALVHEPRVHPERDVVQERTLVDASDVDHSLTAAFVRVERRDRIVAIEAEIPRKVVPRSERHAHERQPALERGFRDGCERTVATGDSQGVRLGARRQLVRILAGLEEVDLQPACDCRRTHVLRARSVTAGPGVHDQEPGQRRLTL
jgi:flagellar biosynthesis/type III secretory pathway protein FliH